MGQGSRDGVSRKLVTAMIVTGGLLTMLSFAKYVDHGAILHDFAARLQGALDLGAAEGGGG